MSHCRASCHSAEVLEVTSPHEWVCLEVFRQFPVYFFDRQLGEVEPAFETFYFQYPKFIFQCLIGTKLDRFLFYFGSLSFGVYRYGFRTGQARAKITDTVQMYLPSVCQFLSHDMRKCVEYSCDVRFCQRTTFLNASSLYVGSYRTVIF